MVFRIEAEQKLPYLYQLKSCFDISPETMFPDLDGFAAQHSHTHSQFSTASWCRHGDVSPPGNGASRARRCPVSLDPHSPSHAMRQIERHARSDDSHRERKGCRPVEVTSEITPLMRIWYAVFCLKTKKR